MPTVTGTLTDFGLMSLAAFKPQLVFHPSGPAFQGDVLLATKPVRVTPDLMGAFAVDLVATDTLRPDAWFTITIEWLDATGGFVGKDFPDWKVRVPQQGGALADLVDAPGGSGLVWVSETPPDDPVNGMWWLNPVTGDLNEWSDA